MRTNGLYMIISVLGLLMLGNYIPRGQKNTHDSSVTTDDATEAVTASMQTTIPASAGVSEIVGQWKVSEVNQIVVRDLELSDVPIFIFDLQKLEVSGNLSCNQFSASLHLDPGVPGQITFYKVSTTLMECPNMDVESQLSVALQEVNRYEVLPDSLLLLFRNDVQLITLVR